MNEPRPEPAAVFVDYRSSGRRWRVLLVVALVLLGLLAASFLVRAVVFGPEATVRAYFSALADRDPAAALRQLAPEVARAEPVLLTEAVLGAPGYAPPERVEVVELTEQDRDAVARVRYTVAGRERTASMRLRRPDGGANGLLPRWLVVDGLGSIIVNEAPEQITVNGVTVPAYDPTGPRILPALPGGYQLGVPDGDPFWQPRTTSVEVSPQQGTELAVPLVVRPEVREEVERQLGRLLDACAAQPRLLPDGCPFGYARLASAEDVQWRITTPPRLRIRGGFQAGRAMMVVTSSRDGEALVTGTPRFGGPLRATVPFPVSGTAVVHGQAVVFRPDW